ncbi:MAG: hypothetical protein UV60_C0028G0004 [Parcubacteria group bacterium GW2011_GWA2_43_11]|nr:MAG: hypothetical protein UU89_C0026G0006 [Parcubacteria group bacterium GW2011_GWC2_42_11]KKS84112.1 MAG: hypothetical protein UV60_C0028G0004 [Parcubacteria group bacterium GW2011_GWA2_43_11]
MSIGNRDEDERFAEMFDPRYAHKYYKDPEKHLSEVIDIIERCAVCQKCGAKSIKVQSVEDKIAVCTACGHTQT